jgi:putative ATPase
VPNEQPDFFASGPSGGGDALPEPPSAQAAGAAREEIGERLDLPRPDAAHRPLAARMRPRNLSEIIGQAHVVGPGCLLPRLVAANSYGSILLYGPPGCGKTSLAEAIAAETKSRFVRVNAVLSNVAELREILRWARGRPEERLLLFIDEIHRFNKSQQDLLLPDIEAGNLRLIGATTHSPGHYVNPPLLSRSHLFRLEPLTVDDIVAVLKRAMADTERGLAATRVTVEEPVYADIARLSDGDLRRALNALETLVLAAPYAGKVGTDDLRAFARERQIRYDADQDEHYDTASAFIKSIRGCDPDAALYWLAKMLAGGEDPRFIARRLVILSSEDIGLADSRALTVAVAAQQAVEFVGLPECELNLAHAVLFLALSPKSNSATEAIGAAKKAIEKGPLQNVPKWLKDAHTQTAKSLGNGEGYIYSHMAEENISGQEYMESPLQFYTPHHAGAEDALAQRLERWKAMKKAIQAEKSDSSGK